MARLAAVPRLLLQSSVDRVGTDMEALHYGLQPLTLRWMP